LSADIATGSGPLPAHTGNGGGFANLRIVTQPLLHLSVGIWIFAGGFVFIEPSPYELMFLLVLPLALIARVGLHRGTLNLFNLMAFFTPFALIAAFQSTYLSPTEALIYVCVTIFLLFTSYFLSNYVADAPYERMRIIMRAYTITAVISALIGLLAYLQLMPRSDLFLLYGRAKSMFQDPNVFGPFLVLPAMFALQKVLLGKKSSAILPALVFGILFLGVFASFSRAAWGNFVLASILVFCLCFLIEAGARQKVRMMILALAGAAILATSIVGLLTIPSVSRLFEDRTSVTQTYDGGETGRFGRQGYAFDLALQHPWGLGPSEFRYLRIKEEPHNTYVNVLHAYGWGGGLAYWVLVVLTLRRGFGTLVKRSPNRLLMIPLISTYFPLAIEAGIVDTDHWRHYFLIVGLIWGVSAGYKRLSKEQTEPEMALI